MKRSVNIKLNRVRKCAFCKYWYDPTNSAIEPKFPKQGVWLYEDSAQSKCLKSNQIRASFSVCSKFETKMGDYGN